MVLHMPRPAKHPKTGVYYFRQRVPADLLQIVGRREVSVSLRTKDPAVAKERHAAEERKISLRWKALRATASPLTNPQIVALAGKFYRDWSGIVEPEPGEPAIWEHSLRLIGELDENVGALERWYGSKVTELLQGEGLATDRLSRVRLIREIHRTARQVSGHQLKRSEGDYRADPSADRFPSLDVLHKPAGAKVTLSGLFEIWKKEHLANGGSPRTPRDHQQKIEALIVFQGHDDAERVDPRKIVEWTEHLRHEGGLEAKTVNDKYLSAVRAVFGIGVQKFLLKASPVRDVRVTVPKRTRTRPPGFTDAEAEQILKAALLAETNPHMCEWSEQNRVACRWVPWICAYSGARVGEIAQLRSEDFKDERGIPYFVITPEAGSVKTGEYRNVPLHPHLVDLGLLDFVGSSGPGPLFYVPNNRKRKEGNTQAQNVSGKVGSWVREIVKVTDVRLQPNHAWRHRFKSVGRIVDVGSEYLDVIQGHEDGRASTDYGEHPISALYREIQKFPRYPE